MFAMQIADVGFSFRFYSCRKAYNLKIRYQIPTVNCMKYFIEINYSKFVSMGLFHYVSLSYIWI